MLLVGAGLLVNSFGRLARVDPGWNASGLLTFYLVTPQDTPHNGRRLLVEELLEELRRTPGVQGAGFTYAGPLLGLIDHFGVFVPPGRAQEEMRGIPDAPQIRSVSHDFLQTMGVRLLAGRWLEPRDDGGAPPVIVVNRSLATRFFGSDGSCGTAGTPGRSDGSAAAASSRCCRRHAAGASGPGARPAVLRRLSSSARPDAGEADARSGAGTPRIWFPVVRGPNGWRPRSFDDRRCDH